MAPKRKLTLEPLEDRTTPALFGSPWPDPQHLTLSFVPDGTPIAGSGSNLFQSLNAVKPAAQWQNEMLRAIQTWESVANINVTVVPDGGQPFGTSGNLQGDSHFGDIRIGAEPMASSSLALAIPPDPTYSGTWAGDIILNSNYTFDGSSTDLYSTMLHEFGHALGLPENFDPSSVMSVNSPTLLSQLSPGDVAAIQSLYGPPGSTGVNGEGENAQFIPADLSPPSSALTTFAQGTLTSTSPSQTSTLYVGASQLFYFSLSANLDALPSDALLQMTITDANGRVLFVQSATEDGENAGAAVFLDSGAYTVRISVISPSEPLTAPLNFQINGTVLSDPIGPKPNDPTVSSPYQGPAGSGTYVYPNGIATTNPYYWVGFVF